MTCAEAAALMMTGGGGSGTPLSELELPSKIDYELLSGSWGNVMVTETYAKTDEHGEYKRYIGLRLNELGTPRESVSSMSIYNKGYNPITGEIEDCATGGYQSIYFSNFDLQ